MVTENQDRIVGKIIVTGEIEALSPLMIGAGEGDVIDGVVVRGYEGNLPYIPATTLAGVLCHRLNADGGGRAARRFWGDLAGNDTGSQSHLTISDLLPKAGSKTPVTVIRDGIRLNPRTGIVEEGAKFNYEVVEPGVVFGLYMEVTIRAWERDYTKDFMDIISRIRALCEAEGFSLGAMTTRGFGRVRLRTENFSVYHFDFRNNPSAAAAWLAYQPGSGKPGVTEIDLPPAVEIGTSFVISADMAIASSLIIGSYPTDPAAPDKVHLESNGKPVLSGTSLRGAIRSRAEKIALTVAGDKAEDAKNLLLNKAFGWVDPDPAKKEEKSEPVKSRVVVDEAVITGVKAEVQNRVRIDRFTGGAADAALFDSMPVWNTGESKVTIRVSIEDYSEEDQWLAGLLLQVLKDLWTGDLPVGGEKGIGRGTLSGRAATITDGERSWRIEQTDTGLRMDREAREALNLLADEFRKKMEGLHV